MAEGDWLCAVSITSCRLIVKLWWGCPFTVVATAIKMKIKNDILLFPIFQIYQKQSSKIRHYLRLRPQQGDSAGRQRVLSSQLRLLLGIHCLLSKKKTTNYLSFGVSFINIELFSSE